MLRVRKWGATQGADPRVQRTRDSVTGQDHQFLAVVV